MASQHTLKLINGILVVQRNINWSHHPLLNGTLVTTAASWRFLRYWNSVAAWRDLLICTLNAPKANWYYYYMEFMSPLCQNLPRNSGSRLTINSIYCMQSGNTYNHWALGGKGGRLTKPAAICKLVDLPNGQSIAESALVVIRSSSGTAAVYTAGERRRCFQIPDSLGGAGKDGIWVSHLGAKSLQISESGRYMCKFKG